MPRIAIVDDNESWCFSLAVALEQHGYTVEKFTNPRLFLDKGCHFDLAVIDWLLPHRNFHIGMDGVDVISQIKRSFSNPPLIILISSYFFVGADDSFCPEADLILQKGTETTELLKQIERLLVKTQ